MAWEIKRIYPQSIWEERDMILQAVKGAFWVYRARHDEEDIKSISVEISCEPECVEADYNGR